MCVGLDPQVAALSSRVWQHPALQDLLRGMNQRILVDNSSWARHVARRLLEHWRERAIGTRTPRWSTPSCRRSPGAPLSCPNGCCLSGA
jgi:hypothetical protein